jgi:hypothetical protein
VGMADQLGPVALCGHSSVPVVTIAVCDHLRPGVSPWVSTYQRYTGVGLAFELLCVPCFDRCEANDAPATGCLCSHCFDEVVDDVVSRDGIRGTPEVRERQAPVAEPVRTYEVPATSAPIIDLAYALAIDCWFGLCADGVIVRLSRDWNAAVAVATVDVVVNPEAESRTSQIPHLRLEVAWSGRFAAVVVDFGQGGVVVDLADGSVTARLDGGDRHTWTVPLSMAFTQLDGRDILSHRSEWNRLDLMDPATGDSLLNRPTPPTTTTDSPEHYLDYFHGRLIVSPDGQYVVDDGWIWHPVGVPVVWDLHRWLTQNCWESEDGDSRRSLGSREYYWNHGICWLDNDRVVVEGIGNDDELMVDGVIIYDIGGATAGLVERPPGILRPEIGPVVLSAEIVQAIAGPAGVLFGSGHQLFSATDAGLSIWSVETEARIGFIPGFNPRYQNRVNGELVALDSPSIHVWRTP